VEGFLAILWLRWAVAVWGVGFLCEVFACVV